MTDVKPDVKSDKCDLFKQIGDYVYKTTIASITKPFNQKKEEPMIQFKNNLIFLKVMLFFVLCVMSIYFVSTYGPITYNNDTALSFVGPLIGESILFGLCIAFSFLILVGLRKGSLNYKCFLPIFAFIFIFFFILNLLFEWSGLTNMSINSSNVSMSSLISYFFEDQQNITTTEPIPITVSEVSNSLSFTSKFILIFIIVIPIISVFLLTPFWSVIKTFLSKISDKYDVYNIIPKYSILSDKKGFSLISLTILLFLLELFLFGLCGLFPSLVMIKNRNATISNSLVFIAEMMAIMIYFNILFQLSGFYSYIDL